MPWELYGNIKYSSICLEFAIIENFSHIIGGVLKGDFEGFWCPNDTRTPGALSRLCVQRVIWTPITLFFDSCDTQTFMSEFADDDFS